ncbi:type VI secretion system baseplate subunit TssF [Glaciecola sp. 1036]|uniref:type VI secretion system baseplate subunit TssF n=1 Tax=Alteromonadaceae TaxID=72275 RepID=UPI003D078A36
MDSKFLQLYNQELKFIRESGAEFAKEYPKIAGRLGLEGFDCADPYVERLLEGFAFMSARVHRKLDAAYPEFTQHLLNLLFPTFLQPIPSCLIVQFHPDFDEGSLVSGVNVDRDTSLISQLGKDEQTPCEYKTVQDTQIWPISLTHAEYLNGQELIGLTNEMSSQYSSKAGIKLVLETPPGMTFSALSMDKLRLHFRGTESFPTYVFETLFKHFSGMLYKTGDSLWRHAQSPVKLSPVGFNQQDALLPYNNRQFDGFRLLREFFVFQQRFLFLDIDQLNPSISLCNHHKLELVFLLDETNSKLEKVLSKEHFALHCAPCINLFPKRAERIQLDKKLTEFHVVPDKLRPLDFEVCSIKGVKGIGNSIDAQHQILPLYSQEHAQSQSFSQGGLFAQPTENPFSFASSVTKHSGFFTSKRTSRTLSVNERKFGHRSSYIGSEVFISLVDPKAAPYSEELQQLAVDTMCSNRDLPLMMPLGKGKTDFSIEVGLPCAAVRCVGEPTRPSPPLNNGDIAWDLINLLSINFLGFTRDENEQALVALKKLLSLMSDRNKQAQSKQIDGIVDMRIDATTGRLPVEGPICFVRGVKITITLDETAYEGSSPFLLGVVLDAFFAQFVGINSFSQLVLMTNDGQEIHQWPIRTGTHSAI